MAYFQPLASNWIEIEATAAGLETLNSTRIVSIFSFQLINSNYDIVDIEKRVLNCVFHQKMKDLSNKWRFPYLCKMFGKKMLV